MSDLEKNPPETGPDVPTEVYETVPDTGSDTPQDATAANEKPDREPQAAVSTARTDRQPSLDDVLAWDGYRVDSIDGEAVAKVEGVFVDSESGAPSWVLMKLGRFGRVVPVSIRECAAAAGRIWVPHDRDVIREAPAVDPTQPLTGDQERQVLDYYGIPETVGRGAELKGRDPEAVTSRP